MDARPDPTDTPPMTPRRIVIGYAMVTLVGWVVALAGVTDLPTTPYVVVDLVLDAAVVLGLFALWRPAWLVAVVLTVVGELFVALHPTTGAILLVIGALQLGLLLLPGLRQNLRERPLVPSH
jgi:hypothetical protein